MKRILMLLLISGMVYAVLGQAPKKFSYQAVARNASGELLSEQKLIIRIGILQDNTSVWQEDQEIHIMECHPVVKPMETTILISDGEQAIKETVAIM